MLRSPFLLLTTVAYFFILTPPSAGQSTIVVDTLLDDGSDPTKCQLSWAITAANNNAAVFGCDAGSGEDTIEFGVEGIISLTSALPSVENESLHIQGPGRFDLAISGELEFRPLTFNSSVPVASIRNLTVANGATTGNGGCIDVSVIDQFTLEDVDIIGCTGARSGALLSFADHTIIRRTLFQGNQTTVGGPGALSVQDALIEDSTFDSNISISTSGALTVNSSNEVIIRRSTFSGNQANGRGGAILLTQSGVLTLEHSTFSGNTADLDNTDILSQAGGGISVAGGTLNLFNTIIAGNFDASGTFSAPDVQISGSPTINTLGHNLIGNSRGSNFDFPAGAPNANNDFVGFSTTSSGTWADAQLGPLSYNGGATPTMIPASSVAIDQGSCGGETRDQRGYYSFPTGLRPVEQDPTNADDGCDIGAIEVGADGVIFADGFESGDTLGWS